MTKPNQVVILPKSNQTAAVWCRSCRCWRCNGHDVFGMVIYVVLELLGVSLVMEDLLLPSLNEHADMNLLWNSTVHFLRLLQCYHHFNLLGHI